MSETEAPSATDAVAAFDRLADRVDTVVRTLAVFEHGQAETAKKLASLATSPALQRTPERDAALFNAAIERMMWPKLNAAMAALDANSREAHATARAARDAHNRSTQFLAAASVIVALSIGAAVWSVRSTPPAPHPVAQVVEVCTKPVPSVAPPSGPTPAPIGGSDRASYEKAFGTGVGER
jgi:hypothetical protein